MRGMGRIYRRGTTFWIQYSHRGRIFRESSHSDREAVARKLLKKRLGEIDMQKFIGPAEERVTFEDLAAALLTDYEVNAKRSIHAARLSVRHLRSYFGTDRAVDITTDRIRAYTLERQNEGAANGSINRELAALKRAFKLTIQAGRLSHAPHVPMLREAGPRQGFLEPADFARLRDALPEHLRDPISFLYLSGWRKTEMKTLEWRDVDMASAIVRLRRERSKNEESRILPLQGELLTIITRVHDDRRLDCPYVFHDDGAPIGDFRKAWRNALRAIGLAEVLIHDMRRSCVRNLVRSGTPEAIAMRLTGHKTRAVFDRYNITSESDLAAASARLDEYLNACQKGAAKVSVLPVRKVA
jgi:integrase